MHFAISSLKLFDTQNVPLSKADGKKDCSFHYRQDTYKINSGWGERTYFFRLKKAVFLFKMISLAERVARINICPGEISTIPALPSCPPAADEAGASGARCFTCSL